ncbi:MAG: LPXTG cell wall anchor domain-containing protein [Anaerolineales bacterium]
MVSTQQQVTIDGQSTMNSDPGVVGSVLRTIKRPRPLLLFYLVTALPALLAAVLITLPGLELARYPVFREALAERNLEFLVEGALPATGESVSLFAALGAMLVALGLLFVRAYLQGGTLLTYAAASPPSGREFLRGCNRWFGPFLLLNFLGSLLALIVLVAFGVVAALVSATLPLAILAAVTGLLVAGLVVLWIEVARATAVLRDDRHAGHALREGTRTLLRRPLPLLALALAGLLLQALLYGVGLPGRSIPIPAWFLSLLFLQLINLVRLAVRLGRWAGEVGLVAPTVPALATEETT